MFKGKIYCAHCIFTGKKYIGQTRQHLLCNRIANHFVVANKNYSDGKFQRALKKIICKNLTGHYWLEPAKYHIFDDKFCRHRIHKYQIVLPIVQKLDIVANREESTTTCLQVSPLISCHAVLKDFFPNLL